MTGWPGEWRCPIPGLQIDRVSTDADLKAFITLPWEVYRHDHYWVPPLISERRDFYDRRKNPFFQHGRAEYFLARRGDRLVGRVSACINDRHNDFHKERCGFFGSFEVLEDPEAAGALLQSAGDWVRAEGMTAMRGPATFSAHDELGLLVAGFDSSPVVLTVYNPQRYIAYIEQAGFKKVMETYAYHLPTHKVSQGALPGKLVRMMERLKRRPGVKVRAASMRKFWREVEYVRHIYNAAWVRNWGFVPPTESEFRKLAANLKQIIDPDLVFFVEIDGEPVGFSLTLPDINEALHLAYPNPRTPEWITLAKMLWHWKVRHKVKTVRLIALGLQEDSRLGGIEALLYYETAQVALNKGYLQGELSWVLETNTMVDRLARMMGAEVYKKWRIYEQDLTANPSNLPVTP